MESRDVSCTSTSISLSFSSSPSSIDLANQSKQCLLASRRNTSRSSDFFRVGFSRRIFFLYWASAKRSTFLITSPSAMKQTVLISSFLGQEIIKEIFYKVVIRNIVKDAGRRAFLVSKKNKLCSLRCTEGHTTYV